MVVDVRAEADPAVPGTVVFTHARRNWLAHAIEGGLFSGSLVLVDTQTIMPAAVHQLGGPAWLVAIVPVMMMIGLTIPGVLTAHYVGTLGRFHPLLMRTGLPLRLPYLFAGLALLFAGDHPAICVAAIAITPLLSGIGNGFSATAWPQLVARTVPAERHASMLATRFIVSSALGVLAGFAVTAILNAHPGPAGFGWLSICAFLGLMCSLAIFAAIREPLDPQPIEPQTSLFTNVRRMPGLLATDRRLRVYLISTAMFAAAGMTVPFLGIHAQEATGQGADLLGRLVSCQMIGSVVGGLVAGWIGDRYGGKPAMMASRVGYIIVFAMAPFMNDAVAWSLLFVIFGAASTAGVIGTGAMQIAMLPGRGRANRLAMMACVMMPIALASSLAGAWLWHVGGQSGFAWLAAVSVMMSGASLLALRSLPVLVPENGGVKKN
jgi:MFS family permease